MNAIQKFTLTLFLMSLGFTSQAQLRHFPHGHTATFVYEDAFVKCSYDSINATQSSHTGDSVHLLWDINLLRCPTPSRVMEVLLSINYLSFDYDSGRLVVREVGFPLIDIPANCVVGQKTLAIQGKSYQYERNDWYQSTGVQDSAAYFYLLTAGKIDYTAEPFILGFTVGWIQLGDYDFHQYSAVKNGIAQNMPAINWQTFYPERAGDVKVWKYSYSFFNEPGKDRGRIDSFMRVDIYPDSIVGMLSRSIQQYDFSWIQPQIISFRITGNPEMLFAFQDSNLGDIINSRYTERIGRYYLKQNKVDPYFQFSYVDEGFWMHSVPCQLGQTADIFTQDDWDSRYGYRFDDYYGFSYETKQLVAARVGNNTFGNLNTLSTGSPTERLLRVYPNPCKHRLYLNDLAENATYSISDIKGIQKQEGSLLNNSISLESLSPGVYILQISSKGGIATARFIKE